MRAAPQKGKSATYMALKLGAAPIGLVVGAEVGSSLQVVNAELNL